VLGQEFFLLVLNRSLGEVPSGPVVLEVFNLLFFTRTVWLKTIEDVPVVDKTGRFCHSCPSFDCCQLWLEEYLLGFLRFKGKIRIYLLCLLLMGQNQTGIVSSERANRFFMHYVTSGLIDQLPRSTRFLYLSEHSLKLGCFSFS